VGRVRDDALGRFYAEAMVADGTDYVNPPVSGDDLPTSRSMIFVSPDGERSMNTYLGISAEISPDDVDTDVMARARLLFLEGYLFDKDKGKAAFLTAAEACRNAGGRAGIALSDPFCVDRHRADFRTLISDQMDYVIGNEEEWLSLYQVTDLDAALDAAASVCGLVACTRSGDGVTIRSGQDKADVAVEKIVPVDATGAGDQFAAGFLYGVATGQSLEMCGRMGCAAAGEVIRHIGPRPETDLKQVFEDQGLA
jgi:sugar/nucleoside kinase (ribokinase family)